MLAISIVLSSIKNILQSIKRGERGEDIFLLKYTIVSFVVFTSTSRLFSFHHLKRLFTWSRYSDSSELIISPSTVVSSAYIVVLSWLYTQSYVKREYNIGDRTQLWGVLVVSDDDKLPLIFTTCGLFNRNSRIRRHVDCRTPTFYMFSDSFEGIIELRAEP